ncbi:unnamed protein product, partial [Phaeothamnion confervicola]
RQLALGPAVGGQGVMSTTARRPRAGWLRRYALSSRPFLAATAMEPELAFLMANLARPPPPPATTTTTTVLDPFCGSASILLAAARLGASATIGSDVDADALDFDGVCANFAVAGLSPPPRLFVADVTAEASPLMELRVDAIVTDPPYEMRAKSRLDGLNRNHQRGGGENSTEDGGTGDRGFSSRDAEFDAVTAADHAVDTVVLRLLRLASRVLNPGGRLVFFWPDSNVAIDHAAGDDKSVPWRGRLPDSFRLVCAGEQRFSPTFSRWLVVLEKVG